MRRVLLPVLSILALAACEAGAGAQDAASTAEQTAAVMPPSAPVATGMRSETRQFRDWFAVCDNGNDCVAFGASTGENGWVRVGLAAGPEARPVVNLGAWPAESAAFEGPLSVSIDGRRFQASYLTGGDDSFPIGTIAPAEVATVIAAMTSGRSMRVTGNGATATVSLSGAAAALLWIDERQGRLDTVTALMRRGTQPAAQVPAPPPLPRVMAAPPFDQAGFGDLDALPASIEAHPVAVACRSETGPRPDLIGQMQAARLDAATELWGVPCFYGPYNFGYRYLLSGPGGQNPRAIAFPSPSGPQDQLINAGFDPETREITAFNKGRGIGDCGDNSTWTWTGRAFVLKEQMLMGPCWGVPADLWPTTWRTR